MSRPLSIVLVDPLVAGVWGVMLLVASLTASSLALAAGLKLSAGTQVAVLVFGGGLFGLSIWMLFRIATRLWERSSALAGLPGPKYNPILGVLNAMTAKDPHRLAADWTNTYGPIFKLRVLFFHIVAVTDPALATHILNSPHFDKFQFMYSFLDPLLNGPSILTGPTDEHWKQVRKGVAPAFSTGHMREALQLVVERSDQLVEYLKRRGPVEAQNMDKLLLRESMDVIGQFGFQKEMNALGSLDEPASIYEGGLSDVDVLLGATHEVEARASGPHRRFMLWKKELWHGASLLRRYRRQVAGLLMHMKKTDPRKGSFAQLLLDAKFHKTGKPLTDEQMIPEIAALFFAGIDTTGHTGTWLLYLLSQNPEVDAKVAAELDSLELLVTPQRPHPRALEYADLAKLDYLQAVVKEVLRIYPPVGIGQFREAMTHVTLAGKLKIPKGTLVWVPHYGIQNAKLNWEEPDKFIPERWLVAGTEYAQTLPLGPEWYQGLDLGGLEPDVHTLSSDCKIDRGCPETCAVDGSRRPKRYFPFAEGPRNCVGQSLAKVSLVATAATLLASMSFRLADQMGGQAGVRKRERYTLVTGIEDGMWMHASPRTGVES